MMKKSGAATKIRTRDPLITNQTSSAQMRQETPDMIEWRMVGR